MYSMTRAPRNTICYESVHILEDTFLIYLWWFEQYISKFPNFSVEIAVMRHPRPGGLQTAASDNIAVSSFTTYFMNMYCMYT